MMDWFADDEKSLEHGRALYAIMHAERLCPKVDRSNAGTLWGELRSMCERKLTGGEMWHEWRPLFEGFAHDQRGAMLHYMQERWTLPVTSFAELEQSFLLEVLRANIEKMCANDLPVMKPALGEQGMQAWEQQAGVRVSEPLRTFAVDVSAGVHIEGNGGLFDFSIYNEDMSTFGQTVRHMDEGDPDANYPRVHDALVGALEFFEAPPMYIDRCTGEQALAHIPASVDVDVGKEALVVGWCVLGNNGEWTDLLITKGPFQGGVVHIESLFHSEGDLTQISFARKSAMEWLREQYHHACLNQEMWFELNLDVEL